jgi:hypothetical protein
MASKKKPAKKAAAKKAAKKTAAKKTAVKKPVASKAGKKKPSKRSPIKRAETLPEGVTRVEVSVLQINNISPVNLSIEDVRGTPQVFYGTTQIDSEIDDVFDAGTTVTTVNWIVTNNAGYTVDVTFGTGSPTAVNNGGFVTQPLAMPAQFACNGTNLFVQKDGELKHDPVIKLKRKSATGQIPNC